MKGTQNSTFFYLIEVLRTEVQYPITKPEIEETDYKEEDDDKVYWNLGWFSTLPKKSKGEISIAMSSAAQENESMWQSIIQHQLYTNKESNFWNDIWELTENQGFRLLRIRNENTIIVIDEKTIIVPQIIAPDKCPPTLLELSLRFWICELNRPSMALPAGCFIRCLLPNPTGSQKTFLEVRWMPYNSERRACRFKSNSSLKSYSFSTCVVDACILPTPSLTFGGANGDLSPDFGQGGNLSKVSTQSSSDSSSLFISDLEQSEALFLGKFSNIISEVWVLIGLKLMLHILLYTSSHFLVRLRTWQWRFFPCFSWAGSKTIQDFNKAIIIFFFIISFFYLGISYSTSVAFLPNIKTWNFEFHSYPKTSQLA